MIEDDEPVIKTNDMDKGEMTEAEIDKTLQDTFPASDPPSWTLGTNHREEASGKEESKKS